MTERILIVDDDEFIRSTVQDVLVHAGYKADVAEDGLDAWEKLDGKGSRFDLILLDKKMPRMDGITLLRRIKSDERFKNLPVIMLTGDKQQQDIIDGLSEGAYYYLTKPSTEEILNLVIKKALDDFREKRELLSLVGHQTKSLHLLQRAEFSLRTLAEAKDLALLLAEVSTDPSRTVNGYSELLVNAVEHGNLGIGYAEKSRLLLEGHWADEIESRLKRTPYSSRKVNVVLEKTPVSCIVTITDQGRGFNWQNYIDFKPERAFDLHGRGIAISKAVSFDVLEFQGTGNTVVSMIRTAEPDR